MNELVLHAKVKILLDQYTTHPPHALVIFGSEGSGKLAIALQLSRQLLNLMSTADVMAYPYLTVVKPADDKHSLGIEAIRELQHLAALKLPNSSILRLIIIPDSQMLTSEAQNALLKLLEEPPANTHFILTATDEQGLLPTIRSRTQRLTLQQPSKTQLEQFYEGAGYETAGIQRAYLMSGGLPGLMHAILANQHHPLIQAAQTARQLLQSSQFERLCAVDALCKHKDEALQMLVILRHMAQAAIDQTAHAHLEPEASTKRLKQWHKVLQASYDAEQAYAVSAQAKLTLTNLMLCL
jgi:hypothetical protein